jgi:aldose 1-epimerase
MAVTNYGARIVTLIVPDKNNQPTDVVVGFDSLQGYLNSTETYHGAIVGRYANRIDKGRFHLNGKTYQLAVNLPPSHLHGGPKGFNKQVWKIEEVKSNSIRLSYFSKDCEENYPGNLNLTVTYTLTDLNELRIDYKATTDQTTILNITSHPFFNLNGQGTGSMENHLLQINADNYTSVDETLIPTGIFTVENTPFDFRRLKTIGQNINDENEQLKFGAGYDHNFVLNGNGLRTAGAAIGNKSGIVMEVITDQPGMQLYTGNWMQGENNIKYGLKDNRREAFCLETQHYPDSPNHPEFPSTVLEPGDVFQSTTIYKFSVKD